MRVFCALIGGIKLCVKQPIQIIMISIGISAAHSRMFRSGIWWATCSVALP
jgi:hypothetical protein